MRIRNRMFCTAAAVLAISSAAWADDFMSAYKNDTSINPAAPAVPAYADSTDIPNQPLYADGAAASEKPLMSGLDAIGIGKPMEDLGLNLYGYVEGGYFYDATVPQNLTSHTSFPGDLIFFPGPSKNEIILDQVDLTLERTISASDSKWDVGFRVEGIFGRDAVFTHSNGILDNSNKDGGGEDDQLDLLQAYFDVNIPVGNGVIVKAGKFVTLLGYESINPTQNAFYTHSYIFSFGVPFTQTGILASYTFDNQWSATAGITRGWNQSTSDNNGAIDFLGQAVYTYSNQWSLTGNLSVGPEAFHDDSDYFVVPEIISQFKMSDDLSLNGDFLYGIAGYVDYTLDPNFTLNGRVEYYHDGHGATTGAGTGTDVNFWEFTGGVAITPLPNDQYFKYLVFRPEIRLDLADQGAFDFNGTSGHNSQLSFAIDATWQF
jgi:hypothetical protein